MRSTRRRHDTVFGDRRTLRSPHVLPALLLAALAVGCAPRHETAPEREEAKETVVFLLGDRPMEPGPVTLCQAAAGADRFVLCLERRAGLDLAGRKIRLRFRGEETPFLGRHRVEGTGAWHDCAYLGDRSRAEGIARALGIPIARRVSRPYAIRTTFECDPAEIDAGANVLVRMRLVNEGPSPVRFDRAIPGGEGRLPCFTVRVTRDGEPVSPISGEPGMIGLAHTAVLSPGEELRETLGLADRVRIDRPGTYEATIVHTLDVVDTPWPFDVAQHCPHLLGNRVERQEGTVRFVVR
jgi:hypothetical protein